MTFAKNGSSQGQNLCSERRICLWKIEGRHAKERFAPATGHTGAIWSAPLYRGTSLIRNNPTPKDHQRALGMSLL